MPFTSYGHRIPEEVSDKSPLLAGGREKCYTGFTSEKGEEQMKEQKTGVFRRLYMPAVLCTALWGSAAPCIKKGYELFAIASDAPFSQLYFAGWRFALAGLLVLLVARIKGHRIVPVRSEWKPIFGSACSRA